MTDKGDAGLKGLVTGGTDAGAAWAMAGCATGAAAADAFTGTLSFMPIFVFTIGAPSGEKSMTMPSVPFT